MTRETKIGLLVGLAFIIVIGILLSDHMTSTTQPPQAALAEAAANVRESATAPAASGPAPAPVGNVPPITPTNPVLTQIELRPPVQPAAPQPPAVTQVHVGGPAGALPHAAAGGAPIAIRQSAAPGSDPAPAQQPAGAAPVVVAGNAAADAAATAVDTAYTIEQWAQLHGEEIVPASAADRTPAQPTPARLEARVHRPVRGQPLADRRPVLRVGHAGQHGPDH
jgi:cytoskeletal protein RodZ